MRYLIKSVVMDAIQEDKETTLMCYKDKDSKALVNFCYECVGRTIGELPQYRLENVYEEQIVNEKLTPAAVDGARQIIMDRALKGGFTHTEYEAFKAIFRELEELYQYRALGTIEQLNNMLRALDNQEYIKDLTQRIQEEEAHCEHCEYKGIAEGCECCSVRGNLSDMEQELEMELKLAAVQK